MVALTNYAAVVRPLQLLVMVIAVLFFARVVRAAQVQSRAVDGTTSGRRRRHSAPLAIVFLEPTVRAGERVEINPAAVVGRGAECDLPLSDMHLSTRHARFAQDNGDLTIEDLGSTNGTYVNQEPIKGRVQLERGDVVQVGGVLFEVVR
jgi:hypothetical protein